MPIARHAARSARPRPGADRHGRSHENRGGKPDSAANTGTDGRVANANGAASPARATYDLGTFPQRVRSVGTTPADENTHAPERRCRKTKRPTPGNASATDTRPRPRKRGPGRDHESTSAKKERRHDTPTERVPNTHTRDRAVHAPHQLAQTVRQSTAKPPDRRRAKARSHAPPGLSRSTIPGTFSRRNARGRSQTSARAACTVSSAHAPSSPEYMRENCWHGGLS